MTDVEALLATPEITLCRASIGDGIKRKDHNTMTERGKAPSRGGLFLAG